MADVVINQQAAIELENGARVGAGLRIEQQLAGHAQMNHEYAAIKRDHDEFAVPFHGFYELTAQALAQRRETLADHVM